MNGRLALLAAALLVASCNFEKQIGAAVDRYCTEHCKGVFLDGGCAECPKYDAGVRADAGIDAGQDAGRPDAGRDAGAGDAGVDAGRFDAGSFTAQVFLPFQVGPVRLTGLSFGGVGPGLPARLVVDGGLVPPRALTTVGPANATALNLDVDGLSVYSKEGLSFADRTRLFLAVTPDPREDGGIALAAIGDNVNSEFVNALAERVTVSSGAPVLSVANQTGASWTPPVVRSDLELTAGNDAGLEYPFPIAFTMPDPGQDTFVLAGRWSAPVDDPTSAQLFRVGANDGFTAVRQNSRIYALNVADAGLVASLGNREYGVLGVPGLSTPLPFMPSAANYRAVSVGGATLTLDATPDAGEYLAVSGASAAAPAPSSTSAPASGAVVGVVNAGRGAMQAGVLADGGPAVLAPGEVRRGFVLLQAGPQSLPGVRSFAVDAGFHLGFLVLTDGDDAGLRALLVDTQRTPWQLLVP